MFTSRAEYRLTLRADNADQRLTPIGITAGIVGSDREVRFAAKVARLNEARRLVTNLIMTSAQANRAGIAVRQDGVRRSAMELLSLPDVNVSRLKQIWPELADIPNEIGEQLEVDAHYAGYLDRQESDILAFRRDESLIIPDEIDYAAVVGLSTECRSKLAAIRPRTLGQASRIDGITPAALTLVLAAVRHQTATADAAAE